MRSFLPMLTMLAMLLTSGCDFFEIENPQELSADDIDDPQLLLPLVNGAEGQFALALTRIVEMSGLASDEFIATGFGSAFGIVDRGLFQADDFNIDHVYSSGVAAIFAADDAARRIRLLLSSEETSQQDRGRLERLLPRAHLIAGFARAYMATSFAFATVEAGPALSPPEVYRQAIEEFTAAVDGARLTGDAALEAHSLGGRARARLYLGEIAAAAADARAALEAGGSFLRRISYNEKTVPNLVSMRMRRRHFAVNQNFIAPPGLDPRTAIAPNGPALKYFTFGADITLIKWQEMHLILAEAAWREGRLEEAETHLNAIRTEGETFTFIDGDTRLEPFSLPPFEIDRSAGATPAADQVRDQIIYERAAEFWLEGLRWPDARRYLDSPFGDPPISPWPPAEWSGTPDPKQVFPIGITEQRQNPHLG